MIRFRLRELMAERQFREGRVITVADVAEATGIHRVTLSRILNQRGYATRTDIVEKLCRYFECEVGDFMQLAPDEAPPSDPIK